MTDKFKVVWPSEEALNAAIASFGKDPACGIPPSIFLLDAIWEAAKVDVPRIVRAEVERALNVFAREAEAQQNAGRASGMWWDGSGTWRTAYLARFPEAAPEPKMGETLHTCTMGPDCPNHQTYITPTAPAQFVCVKGCGYAGLEAHRCKNCPDVVAPEAVSLEDCRHGVLLEDCPTCHPTPSAPAKCILCDDTGWIPGNLDSSLRVKCSCAAAQRRKCERGCSWPDKLCDTSCVAAARPEAEGPRGGKWSIFDGLVGSCSACQCSMCQAERAFVRALMEDVNNAEWDVSPKCAEAADRMMRGMKP